MNLFMTTLRNDSMRVLALLALLAMGGCASWWGNLFGGKDTSEKPAPLVEFKASAPLRVLWQANIGSADTAFFSPAVEGEQVYVAAANGQLASLDKSTGRVVWQVSTDKKLSGGVGAGEGLVAVGSAKGEVLAYDKSGKQLWVSPLSSEILAPPQIAGNLVLARTIDGKIFALNGADGKSKWVYQRAVPALSLRTPAGILIHRGAVFAGFAGGKMVALDVANGNVGWEATVALPKGATELERIADVSGTPVTDGQHVYAVAYQGKVAALDINSGNPVWSKDISSAAGLGLDQQNIYVSDVRGNVHALSKANGASMWKQDKLTARALSAPASNNKFIAVGDLQGYIHFLSPEDGSFVNRVATDGSAIRVQPLVENQSFLIQTERGGVYALGL